MLTGFFAYPSRPRSVGDSIAEAVDKINHAGEIEIVPWTRLAIGGKIIISEVCDRIAKSDLVFADITDLNPNVLFELGYAIAKDKRVWLTLDNTFTESNAKLNRFRTLASIGYVQYQNSLDIVNQFYRDLPHKELAKTVYSQVVLPHLASGAGAERDILYLKARHEIEASVKIDRRLENSRLSAITDDPRESPIQPLSWYGRHIALTLGCVCHLTDPAREDAGIYNARSAFVAGMAHAMGKPLLMLIEGDYLSPVDYRDLAHHYTHSAQALRNLESWLGQLEAQHHDLETKRRDYVRTTARVNQLKSLQVGEHIAEHESEVLVDEYFVDTAAYSDALSGQHTVFVGRKGSGKSATFYKLAATLKADRRNLVTTIKPVAYDVQGVVRLLTQVKEQDVKGYAMEAMWKYLLLTEIGNCMAQEIESRDPMAYTEEERALLALMDRRDLRLRDSFPDRLERKVEEYRYTERVRASVSEDLHRGILKELRDAISAALGTRQRVAVIVDNLDLAWDRREDLQFLSQVILSLLDAARSLAGDLHSTKQRHAATRVSLAIFLRSDVYARVVEHAPEPDKIGLCKLFWSDRELLGRVIDERMEHSQGDVVQAKEIWKQFFVAKVNGVPTRSYILNVVLPRPRDLVFFVKSAITTAVNRGHTLVEEDDVLEAEARYSQYATEILAIESTIASARIDDLLLAFIGSTAELGASEVHKRIGTTNVAPETVSSIVERLCALSVLGIEVRHGQFEYADDMSDLKRLMAMARRVAQEAGTEQRFSIHPAFWSFLDIKRDFECYRQLRLHDGRD